jgi:hypothetical protein
MNARTVVTWRNVGEAARWLAAYVSAPWECKDAWHAINREFAESRDLLVDRSGIAAAALLEILAHTSRSTWGRRALADLGTLRLGMRCDACSRPFDAGPETDPAVLRGRS